MLRRAVIVFFGIGAGIALGAGAAAADSGTSPIDTWLYTDGAAGEATLPGYAEPELANTYYHAGSLKPWYTADTTSSGDTTETTVTKILDPSYGYPSVGAVEDRTVVNLPGNPLGQPPQLYNLYLDNHLSDPNLGSGDFTSYFNGEFTNFYVSDAAGIEDEVSFFHGPPIVLFDIPAADAVAGPDLF